MSSSMVFESADSWPSYEGQEREIPPPISSYGFQKLAVEYFARAAHAPVRAAVHDRAAVQLRRHRRDARPADVEVLSGNVKLAMSHVVPDLVQKIVKGQDPLHILGDGNQMRHYTYGGDLAKGIVTAMEHPDALNDDFNLSTARVDHGARARREHLAPAQGPDVPFRYVARRRRSSTTCRSGSRPSRRPSDVLGFEATTTLDEMLDEVMPWVVDAIDNGLI